MGIKEAQGGITEDETVQFKSYLLSLGIDDPVTKETAGSDKKYYQGLAQEMFLILDGPVQEAGGMVLRSQAVDEEEQRQSLCNLVESAGSLTPEELGQQQGLSVILARERLVSAETEGVLCRDDSVEGLRFFPNLFLTKAAA